MPRLAAMRRMVVLFSLFTPLSLFCQQRTPDEFYADQTAIFLRSLNNPSLNSRVRNIWFQLQRYSNRMYAVLPAQQYTAGQSLPNGVILLDVSSAGDDHVEVAAFWLGHEWGHQVLGHPYLQLTPVGRYLMAVSGTAQEDAADRYSARFLKETGYQIEPVLSMLCTIPSAPGDTHSDGPTRARNVARAYGSTNTDPCSDPPPAPDTTTYSARFRIWSKFQGNLTTMDISVDGTSVGSLSNLRSTETLDLGDLTEGRHSYELSNITVYGPMGIMAQGLACAGNFRLRADTTFQLSARLLPNGEMACAATH